MNSKKNIAQVLDTTHDVISIVRDLTTLIQSVIDAATKKPRVDIKDLLPGTLLTTIAKTAADLRAKEKFDE